MSCIEADPHVSINNQDINRVSRTKTLDFFTDENITWKTHIEQACKKVSKGIDVFTKSKGCN